jgi:hypothetical protein
MPSENPTFLPFAHHQVGGTITELNLRKLAKNNVIYARLTTRPHRDWGAYEVALQGELAWRFVGRGFGVGAQVIMTLSNLTLYESPNPQDRRPRAFRAKVRRFWAPGEAISQAPGPTASLRDKKSPAPKAASVFWVESAADSSGYFAADSSDDSLADFSDDFSENLMTNSSSDFSNDFSNDFWPDLTASDPQPVGPATRPPATGLGPEPTSLGLGSSGQPLESGQKLAPPWLRATTSGIYEFQPPARPGLTDRSSPPWNGSRRLDPRPELTSWELQSLIPPGPAESDSLEPPEGS